jgi:outer membrane protein OmpA-like peptidoglycan-associated protein
LSDNLFYNLTELFLKRTKKMNFTKAILFSFICMFIFSGCAKDEFGNPRSMNNTEKGTMIGALGGAVIGGLTSDRKARGALIGAVGGGLAGAVVGKYMDNQRRDLEKVLARERDSGVITIERVGENSLRITMTSQSAFDVDSASIKQNFYSTLDKTSDVLNQYGKTMLTIVGHTDNTGTESHNQALSERRAQSVNEYMLQRHVHQERLAFYGRGENEPRASNVTEAGRQVNRRVEILVEPIVASNKS